ncbi:hypothetical protein HZI73_22305 [Vallitalea pronyensis]|uniref:Hemolysin XhlA n=1 Tax=Vallitalea pronyensis TaxID=1348613 RepID=A0A8J8MNQ8_9FIRM|nr:hypothetical protein [Vallitalea pronyensis]QUI24864.1 hypothetical protein HZI73_22305 [Vallitalea pronyensis]
MKTYDEILDDHEARIQVLEKTDVQLIERIEHLIKQMELVAGWIKWLIITIIVSLSGFFFWYIQNIPMKG